MSSVQKMREFVNQRLNAAVEEILAAFEKSILKYEEEAALSQEVISRQHALLCALHKPVMNSPSADVFTQQLLVKKEVLSKQENQNPQQEMVPESSLFKEEKQEELLQGLDENEIIEFTYNSSLAVKACEDLQPRRAGPDEDVSVVLSSETEDSEDYSKGPDDSTLATDKSQALSRPKGFSCSVCSRTFKARGFLLRHMKSHVLEAKQVCGLCGKQCESPDDLKHHILTHRKKRKAWAQNREKRLQERTKLNRTTEVQKSPKPDKCNDCGKTPLRRRHNCLSQKKNQDQNNPEKPKKRRKRRRRQI